MQMSVMQRNPHVGTKADCAQVVLTWCWLGQRNEHSHNGPLASDMEGKWTGRRHSSGSAAAELTSMVRSLEALQLGPIVGQRLAIGQCKEMGRLLRPRERSQAAATTGARLVVPLSQEL